MSSPSAEGEADDVAVTVVRSGGIAGVSRSWHATAPAAEAPRWLALIDGCPWEAVAGASDSPAPGADRFVWRISARCGYEERGAELADSALQGPWRELVDEVRAAAPPPSA